MRVLIAAACFGTAVALAAPPAQGIGVPAKTTAKKIQGDLVPAVYPAAKSRGTGDDEGDDPAILDTPLLRSNCTFDSGKFTVQAGKNAVVQLTNVRCGGFVYNGSLCAHTKTLSTIVDEEIDKNGFSTPVSCISPASTETAGTVQFVTGNVGLITCTKGKCKGTLPPVAADPCPDVDKMGELRRVEVFDGPDIGQAIIQGATLSACCGPGQTTVGPIPVSLSPPCDTSTQDVMAEMGYVTQGVKPK